MRPQVEQMYRREYGLLWLWERMNVDQFTLSVQADGGADYKRIICNENIEYQ